MQQENIIIIKDYQKNISIGYYEHEKNHKQIVFFCLKLYFNQPQIITIDTIINYDQVIRTINRLTDNLHYNFLEELAPKLIFQISNNFDIIKLTIKIKKINAVNGAKYCALKCKWLKTH